MSLNSVEHSHGRILIFRSDVEFNDECRKIIYNIDQSSKFSDDVENEDYYKNNKEKIDDDINAYGYSIFNSASYEAYSASLRETIITAYENISVLKV